MSHLAIIFLGSVHISPEPHISSIVHHHIFVFSCVVGSPFLFLNTLTVPYIMFLFSVYREEISQIYSKFDDHKYVKPENTSTETWALDQYSFLRADSLMGASSESCLSSISSDRSFCASAASCSAAFNFDRGSPRCSFPYVSVITKNAVIPAAIAKSFKELSSERGRHARAIPAAILKPSWVS
jgi:hypothetical protein